MVSPAKQLQSDLKFEPVRATNTATRRHQDGRDSAGYLVDTLDIEWWGRLFDVLLVRWSYLRVTQSGNAPHKFHVA